MKIAMKVGRRMIGVNIVLSAFELFAGIFANSAAMVADSVHCMTDIITTSMALIGIKMGNQKPDDKHLYGHDRFESIAALGISLFIFFIGLGIGLNGAKNLLSSTHAELNVPGLLALIAAATSIIIKEGMFWYEKYYAKKLDSTALLADAWHSRSDAFSSVGSFFGILIARMGYPIFDSVAALIICVFILKTAVDVAIKAIDGMTDRACDSKTVEEMKKVILELDHIKGIDNIKTRTLGNKIFVDLEISMDGKTTLDNAHEIAHITKESIQAKFPKVKDCMVHINPTNSKKAIK